LTETAVLSSGSAGKVCSVHAGAKLTGINSNDTLIALKKRPHLCLVLLLGLFTWSSGSLWAQELLEKRISFRAADESLDQVLGKISDLGGFSFSYSPDAIEVRGRVTYQANNLSVREVLNELFKGRVKFKQRKKFIILQKNNTPEDVRPPENFQLNGYVTDNRTGERLANASIFEPVTLASAVSNDYGYYKIKLPTAPADIRLEVRKEEYVGRSITVTNRKDAFLPIILNPDTLKSIAAAPLKISLRIQAQDPKIEIPPLEARANNPAFTDTTRKYGFPDQPEKLKNTYRKVQSELVSAFASARQSVNTRNIQDTLHRSFQASLLPFLGTNHQLSGNIVNDVSINLIAGYAMGVNQIEIGAVMNVVRGNVKGFQLAGVGNIVGNDVNGFQYANVLNITLGNVSGFQGSNSINFAGKNLRGLQVAGVGNVVVGTLHGWQISTGYNYANTVRSGHQIGLVNYSDSTATIPFGLFSYVRSNGYRRYEFATNEFNYFNFAFKTGVSRFYNVFTLGFNGLAPDRSLCTVGYGFGTSQNLGRSWAVDADLTGQLVLVRNQKLDELPAGMVRFAPSIEKKLNKRLALFAGPSLNLLATNSRKSLIVESRGIQPLWLHGKSEQANGYGWLGFQVGVRFCNRI
jgi:hypothetical protein